MIPAPGVFLAGIVIFLIVIWDAFEAIILPRRVTRKIRLARFYYQFTWETWRFYARLIQSKKRRETFLGFYGPISLLFLIGVWAAGLILSFAMMQYGAGSAVNLTGIAPSFYTDLYLSGTTFFTLGLGDVVPRSGFARFLVVVEVRPWFRLSRCRDRLSAFYIRRIRRPRNQNRFARCPGRHAAHCRRTPLPPQLSPRP